MSERKLVIYAEISLPPDLSEAGRIQMAWAEQVKKFNAGLTDGVGKLDLRVASSRPRTAKAKVTEPPGPPLSAPVGPEPQGNGVEVQAQDDTAPPPAQTGGQKVPPWTQR